MLDEKLKRINELARKSREVDLTDEEKQEQQRLRKEYAAAFRGNMEAQLQSIVLVDEHGNYHKLHKK